MFLTISEQTAYFILFSEVIKIQEKKHLKLWFSETADILPETDVKFPEKFPKTASDYFLAEM
jgi:hypothetical protein